MNTFHAGRRNLALYAAALLVSAAFAGRASAEEYVKTYSVGEHADVRIHADESSVRVITEDTHQVEFRVVAQGIRAGIQIGSKFKVDSYQNGDTVELTVNAPAGFSIGVVSRSIKTEVHMPRNADLTINTHDGAVEVSSLNGRVMIRTADGSITASQLSGNIELKSGDGSIGAHDIDGKLNVSSRDGAIRADGRFDILNVWTGDGSVVARAARGSHMESAWSVETRDGSVRVAVPSDLQANLNVSSRDGRINVELPVTVQGYHSKSEVQGTLNGGGPSLTVHSGDGSIRVEGI